MRVSTAGLLVLVLCGLWTAPTTLAAFTDAPAASTSSVARKLDPPSGVRCTGDRTTNRYVTWSPPADQPVSGYRVHFTNTATGATQSRLVNEPRWRPEYELVSFATYEVRVESIFGTWASVRSQPANIRLEVILFPAWSCV
jgi:hypothetical protein